MKKFIRIIAVMTVITLIALIGCGCHKKDEVAFTIGGHTFTSAMYSCVQYIAASTARSAISTYVKDNSGDTTTIKYEDYKFDEAGNVSDTGTVTYENRIKNEAVKVLTQYATLLTKMGEENLTMDEDTVNAAKYNAQCEWQVGCDVQTYQNFYTQYNTDPAQYFTPYSTNLQKNGVAYSTFEQYMIYEFNYNYYFSHVYGENGVKQIPDADLTSYLDEHYILIDSIQFSKKDSSGNDLSDEALATLKAKADAYAERVNGGEEFSKVYDEYKAEQSATSGNTQADAAENSDSDTYTPPEYAGILGDSETNIGTTYFADVKALDQGKALVADDTQNSIYVIVVKRDITAEKYYLDAYRTTVMTALKGDEYEADINEYGKTLTVDESTYATRQFKAKNIKFDET